MGKNPQHLTPSGVVLIDKPAGMTSHDVIARLRRITGHKKIGHAGTLDPLATGLLIVLFGAATRLSEILTGHNKSYEATVRFGQSTTTDDSDGEIIQETPVPEHVYDRAFAENTVRELIGTHSQRPPQVSALKFEGKRAHEMVRRGEHVELKPRSIEILDAHLLEVMPDEQSWRISFKVSKGTYIRAIARDLGEALGCGAHISALRRMDTYDGILSLDQAHTLDGIEALYDEMGRISDVFLPLKTLNLNFDDQLLAKDHDVLCGRYQYTVRPEAQLPSMSGIPLMSLDGRLLALGSYNQEDGSRELSSARHLYRIKPDTVFPGGILGPRITKCAATVGVFDGVHRGHQKLIDETVARARALDAQSVVFTFDPSPKDFFNPHKRVYPLASLQRRIELIKSRGVDKVVIIPFNEMIAQLSGADFLREFILNRADVRALVLGQDFHFGRGAADTALSIEESCRAACIDIEVAGLVLDDQTRVSSTHIRMLLGAGEIERAQELLGHFVEFEGYVTQGVAMGRTLGFPTANIEPSIDLALGDGVYAARVYVNNKNYNAGLFVGTPRDESQKKTFEVHLLNFLGTLYGNEIRVEVLSKVNDVQRFHSFDDLKKGVAHNVELVKNYFE